MEDVGCSDGAARINSGRTRALGFWDGGDEGEQITTAEEFGEEQGGDGFFLGSEFRFPIEKERWRGDKVGMGGRIFIYLFFVIIQFNKGNKKKTEIIIFLC
ncbi:unnamed protein product [Linum tenue]|uniref:Uncharacterized protein n=1 Tax=Linum tenue TaxID=586396 RepID=A0AAV0RH51_9ROSI|nr:unnamed protein product [Linum tenue]